MLDTDYILQNIERVKSACRKKGLKESLADDFVALDQEWKTLLQQAQTIREKRNKLTAGLKGKPDEKTVAEGKKLKDELAVLEKQQAELEKKRKAALLYIPNIPSDDTPEGKEEKDRKIVRKWGDMPKFGFVPKSHLELGNIHDLIDTERGAKTAGFRGYFLKKEAVLLQQAILQYALQKLVKKGFTPLIAPTVCKKRAFINTGHFPWGEEEAYRLSGEDDNIRYLAGTSEVGMVSYHQDEVLDEKQLPLKYCAITPCFRREIGSYGKDTKGIYRVHEFMKVEQVVLCKADKAESEKLFEEIAGNAEEILKDLELPYRVCLMPAGDMGEPQYKKYDIEVWMPSRESYGEAMSCSQMLDFQARRANIKYKDSKGEKRYVYTLNNTAIASPRILIALLEIHQQKDGSIRIPKALSSYLGKDKIF